MAGAVGSAGGRGPSLRRSMPVSVKIPAIGVNSKLLHLGVNSDGSIFVGVSNQTPASASDAEMLVLTFKSIKAVAAAEISVASLNLQGAAGRTIAYNGVTPFRTTITP